VELPPPAAAPPDQPTPDQLNSSRRRSQARDEVLASLKARWPRTFPADFEQIKPFAVGLHLEILKALPDVNPSLIRHAIRVFQYGGYGAYWRAILQGGPRYNLDGIPTGEVTADDQAHAKETLAGLRAQWKARRARRTQATPAPSEQQEIP
jgi:sRNA-binding protein